MRPTVSWRQLRDDYERSGYRFICHISTDFAVFWGHPSPELDEFVRLATEFNAIATCCLTGLSRPLFFLTGCGGYSDWYASDRRIRLAFLDWLILKDVPPLIPANAGIDAGTITPDTDSTTRQQCPN